MKYKIIIFFFVFLFIQKANANQKNIFDAIKSNNLVYLQENLTSENVDLQDQKGYTPLIMAVYYQQDEIVNFLISKKADICKADFRGNTALMGATFKGSFSSAKILLEQNKCKVDQSNNQGQTALMLASLFAKDDFVDYLLEQGANPLKKDKAGNSAISLAKAQGNNEIVEKLSKK